MESAIARRGGLYRRESAPRDHHSVVDLVNELNAANAMVLKDIENDEAFFNRFKGQIG